MAGRSYKRINYTIRPAKAVERRIMCDIIRRVVVFRPYSAYRYIGMGSLYFVDFAMVHRATGIEDMTSIELDSGPDIKKRFEFNRPFECVQIGWMQSTAFLHGLPRDPAPTVLWLDYDYDLNDTALNDIDELVSVVSSGSMYFATIRVQTESTDLSDKRAYFLETYKQETVDLISDKELDGKTGVSRVCARLLSERIRSALFARNVAAEVGDKLEFYPLLSLQYEDGVTMYTLGGVFVNEADVAKISAFSDGYIPFVQLNAIEPQQLKVPLLTSKEVKHLCVVGREGLPGVKPADLDAFLKIRRYYPHYFDVDW